MTYMEEAYKNIVRNSPGEPEYHRTVWEIGERLWLSVRALCRNCKSIHTGESIDIPSADFGAGIVEIGYLFGGYKRLAGTHEGAITGKGLSFGGTQIRPQATGYGLAYILESMLHHVGIGLEGKRAVISGSGKVAIHTADKLTQLRARVVALSDSDGVIYDKNGVQLNVVRQIKQEVREGFWGSLKEYEDLVPGSVYSEGRGIWSVPCDIALPCAAEGELDLEAVKALAGNGCIAIAEGAIQPLTRKAQASLPEYGILYLPGKAANIGGVVMSTLELAQNSVKQTWSAAEADAKLRWSMERIFTNCAEAAERYGAAGDYLAGANIYAFEKVTDAIRTQGYI